MGTYSMSFNFLGLLNFGRICFPNYLTAKKWDHILLMVGKCGKSTDRRKSGITIYYQFKNICEVLFSSISLNTHLRQ